MEKAVENGNEPFGAVLVKDGVLKSYFSNHIKPTLWSQAANRN